MPFNQNIANLNLPYNNDLNNLIALNNILKNSELNDNNFSNLLQNPLLNYSDFLQNSLFNKPEKHMAILEALAGKKEGLTRNDLLKIKSIGGGSVLTKDLRELEECGFIRKFTNYTKEDSEEEEDTSNSDY